MRTVIEHRIVNALLDLDHRRLQMWSKLFARLFQELRCHVLDIDRNLTSGMSLAFVRGLDNLDDIFVTASLENLQCLFGRNFRSRSLLQTCRWFAIYLQVWPGTRAKAREGQN